MYEITLIDTRTGEAAGLECAKDCPLPGMGVCRTSNPLYTHEEFDDFVRQYELDFHGQQTLQGLNGLPCAIAASTAIAAIFRIGPVVTDADESDCARALQAFAEVVKINLEEFPTVTGLVAEYMRHHQRQIVNELAHKHPEDPLSLVSFGKFLVKLYELCASAHTEEVIGVTEIRVVSVPDEIAEVAEMELKSKTTGNQPSDEIYEFFKGLADKGH